MCMLTGDVRTGWWEQPVKFRRPLHKPPPPSLPQKSMGEDEPGAWRSKTEMAADASRSSSSTQLQHKLQLAVQSVGWTYIIFWQLCPEQGILVWGDGYYNGAIKTRKTVQPMEVSPEEASLERSQLLRELYESMASGEIGTPRPCAALSPEDLTECEWFYLMCLPASFPPGVGLPGKAFERQRPIWLPDANEVDSKVFSRAILAKSAQIQSVLCIPLMHGVVELGTVENVEEDEELIQHVKSLFTDHHDHQPKPALSEHSTSNSVAHKHQNLFNFKPMLMTTQSKCLKPHESIQGNENNKAVNDGDCDEEEEDDDDDAEREVGTDTDAEFETYNACISTQQIMPPNVCASLAAPSAEPSILMQMEMSDSIRLISPANCPNNLDTELQMLMTDHNSSRQSENLHAQDNYQACHLLHEMCSGFPELSASAILHGNSSQWSDPITPWVHSQYSAFSKWTYKDQIIPMSFKGTSQRLLKYILFKVPNLHCKVKFGNSPRSKDGDGASRFQNGTSQEEQSASHVLAERRRREKLNARFIILRSLVPFVTKMDKTSILGDTIEHVKQLKRRIQSLESQKKLIKSDSRASVTEVCNSPSNSGRGIIASQMNSASAQTRRNRVSIPYTRKLKAVEQETATPGKSDVKTVEALRSTVQVSIIECDALLELQCPYRDGLLLQIMQTLNKLKLEITCIQCSSVNGIYTAELRAKVKGIDQKKANIVEVKKAIYRVFSQ